MSKANLIKALVNFGVDKKTARYFAAILSDWKFRKLYNKASQTKSESESLEDAFYSFAGEQLSKLIREREAVAKYLAPKVYRQIRHAN